ncbi:MAG: A/G-specific adenine glycosylase [Bdellovibrionota bacterium]
MSPKSVHKNILAWYGKNKRALPWRKNKDPYRIWISEIMLQQTRVETVIPYYERFLSNFPTVADLAAAETDKLLNLWAGLGYYSRARNLKKAAEAVMANFSGKMPEDFESLRTLSGIGPYTAAAISSIAHDEARAAVDGNLERVFSRLLVLRDDPKVAGKPAVEKLGAELVAFGNAGDLNQAFMDLSSGVCLPKVPLCMSCPLFAECEARKQGIQSEIPVKKTKKAPIELEASGVILIAENELLLARRPVGEWLAGLWDLPWWIGKPETNFTLGEEFGNHTQNRTITKHKIAFTVRAFRTGKKPAEKALQKIPAPAAEYKWVKLEDLHGVNLPRPSERSLNKVLEKKY